VYATFVVFQYRVPWNTVMEIAERGMIMNFKDCNESITPLPADTCRRYFHDLLLGLEFCMSFFSNLWC